MAEQARFLLTTMDNPHSPFDDWVAWYMEDLRLGHDTCGLIARLASVSGVIDDDAEVAAIRDIVNSNFSGLHIAVVPSDYNPKLKPIQLE